MKYKNRNRNIFLWSIIFIMPLILFSCMPIQNSTDLKDLSYIYNPTKKAFNPSYVIKNISDTSSVLSIRFNPGELYFSEANPQVSSQALMLISVKLYNLNQGRQLADTAVLNTSIIKEKSKTEYICTLPLKVNKGNEYVAEVRILDRLRLKIVQAFVSFNTISAENSYNFKLQGNFDKNELFTKVLRVNEFINLVYLRGHFDSLYISYYKPFAEVPDPPSMLLPEKTLDYDPERTVAVPYSDTLPIMLPREGIYFFATERQKTEGYTLINFGETFPSMTKPEAMMQPLVYLTSLSELNELTSSIKPKVALDEFWIKCGGNIEKARELIRIYYTRVLYSNIYFTSYKEGWRTERGMIYIIYGPPDKVYKTIEGENWGYKKPKVESKWGSRYGSKEDYLFFNFKKKNNKFSDNDYFLSRNESLVTFWDKAVASWRKGVVFRLDNPEDLQ